MTVSSVQRAKGRGQKAVNSENGRELMNKSVITIALSAELSAFSFLGALLFRAVKIFSLCPILARSP